MTLWTRVCSHWHANPFADDNSTIYTNIGIDCANIGVTARDPGVPFRRGRHRDSGEWDDRTGQDTAGQEQGGTGRWEEVNNAKATRPTVCPFWGVIKIYSWNSIIRQVDAGGRVLSAVVSVNVHLTITTVAEKRPQSPPSKYLFAQVSAAQVPTKGSGARASARGRHSAVSLGAGPCPCTLDRPLHSSIMQMRRLPWKIWKIE